MITFPLESTPKLDVSRSYLSYSKFSYQSLKPVHDVVGASVAVVDWPYEIPEAPICFLLVTDPPMVVGAVPTKNS